MPDLPRFAVYASAGFIVLVAAVVAGVEWVDARRQRTINHRKAR